MKKCNVCEETKPLTEFYKEKDMPDGYRKMCKACKNKKTAEWRESNRVKYNTTMRTYNKKHYDRLRLQRYDLVPAEYSKMLLDQMGRCAICDKPPTTIRPLNIDHDHSTGKTRGLLCHGCNRAMHLLDSPEFLTRALAYKKKYS